MGLSPPLNAQHFWNEPPVRAVPTQVKTQFWAEDKGHRGCPLKAATGTRVYRSQCLLSPKTCLTEKTSTQKISHVCATRYYSFFFFLKKYKKVLLFMQQIPLPKSLYL